jgi:hypothetical protein
MNSSTETSSPVFGSHSTGRWPEKSTNHSTLQHGQTRNGVPARGPAEELFSHPPRRRRGVVGDNLLEPFAVEPVDAGNSSAAEPHGAVQDRFEDGLDVGGRATDHTKDLARRGLLIERLGYLGMRLRERRFFRCSSVSRRTFSMAMTAWSANVSTRAISPRLYGWARPRATKRTPSASSLRMSGINRSAREIHLRIRGPKGWVGCVWYMNRATFEKCTTHEPVS